MFTSRLYCRVAFALMFVALMRGQASAGPPFSTDDPEPTDTGHFEIYLYSDGTQADHTTAGTVLGAEVNYGIFPDTQVSVALPLESQPTDGDESAFGFGTAAVGVKYRFLHEDTEGVDVAFFPSAEIPFNGSRDSVAREFFPIWAEKSFGDWTISGGGGYWNNPGPENRNYWFYGAALTRRLLPGLCLGGELYRQTADQIGGVESMGGDIGLVFDFTESLHLMGSAGAGLQNASSTNQFSYYLALQWTP